MRDILIVEDEAIVALINKKMLQFLGYNVTACLKTYDEVIAYMRQNTVHLILMDIKIKGDKDGVDTAEEIRKTNNLPIIFVTGNSDTRTMERIARISNSDFLIKPILEGEMQKKLVQMLKS